MVAARRLAGLVPEAVQHDAVRVLRLHGRLQLRQSQRQVVLAVDDRAAADDARRGPRHRAVHQPLFGLRRPGQRRRVPQPDHRRAGLPARLDRTLDRLQLRHGASELLRSKYLLIDSGHLENGGHLGFFKGQSILHCQVNIPS